VKASARKQFSLNLGVLKWPNCGIVRGGRSLSHNDASTFQIAVRDLVFGIDASFFIILSQLYSRTVLERCGILYRINFNDMHAWYL
jgi:hypothetical protein